MKAKTVSGLMITLLLTNMLTLAFRIQKVEASSTIYIRADGSIDPPTAPIHTVDNITYTVTDNISETIVIQRNNIVVNGAGYTVQGTGSGNNGIYLSSVSYVTVKNTRVVNFSTGIRLGYSQYCTLVDNYISSTYVGIALVSSNINTFYGNTVSNNVSDLNYGIYLYLSGTNTFSRNTISLNRVGIYIRASGNIFSGNNISDNWTGIDLYYGGDNKIFHNNFINNTQQVYIYLDFRDKFDDGYPSGGNYWSDYTGIDMYSGLYQNETGTDGIGDTPYFVNATYPPYSPLNQDNYPLMKNWDATSPWADDDNDGILNYLDVPNFGPLSSGALGTLLGFDWSVVISDIEHEANYAYMMEGLYKWGVKTTDIQRFMFPVVMDLGNVMGALEWLRYYAPFVISDQMVNTAREYLCSDGHYRLLFFVHSDFEWGETLTVIAELVKALCSSGFALEKWLDFVIDWWDFVEFELYLLKGVYSVSANLIIDLGGFAEFANEFMMAWKDVLMILLTLEIAFITATTAGGPAFAVLAAKVFARAFQLFLDYIVFDHLKIRHGFLDWVKIFFIAVDPPGEKIVLQLRNATTDELLLGYNATSGSDISVFPYGIYSSDNDSGIMILTRSVANYNFTVTRNVSNWSSLPYTLVTWDCMENTTVTTGGFLDLNQSVSVAMQVENDVLEMSYLIVEANFSDFTPHVGDEVIVNINVTDNLGHTIEDANTIIVVDDQFILAQDLGNGKYQAILDTTSMLGFYNVTVFTAETPTGYLQGMNNYPLRVGTADLAITNVTCSKAVIGQNYTAYVNVTVQNNGNLNETFYLTLYANTTVVQKQAVISLSSGNLTTVTFTWNTTDFAYGNYTISAVADTLPSETDPTDNTYVDGLVIVTIPGDINGDFDVDRYDFGDFAGAYGSCKGDPRYLPAADLNCDGCIDRYDFGIFAGNYGKTV